LTRWTILSPLTGTISVNNALVRFEVRRRRWLFPPLVRNKTPDPVRRNRFEVALWVFNLNLPDFILRGTANSSQQITLLEAQRQIIPEFSKFREKEGCEKKDYLLMTANELRSLGNDGFFAFFLFDPFLLSRFSGCKHHVHGAAFHIGRLFNGRNVSQFFCDLLQIF